MKPSKTDSKPFGLLRKLALASCLIGASLTRAVKRNQQLLWSDLDGVTPLAND